ncbi:thrombospondin-type laminin G domain and EAR repeat-containing protein-like [Aplochiton taeniatus]
MSSLFLLLVLGLRVIGSATGTWRPCTDPLPLDILSHILPAGSSAPLPGVHLIQAGGVRGVRLSQPHPSLSFPSSQLLVNCELLPREFSVVVTLKVSHMAPKRNEYILSVIEDTDKGNRVVKAEQDEEDNVRDLQSDGVKDGEKADGQMILGLRVSRDRFHYLFKEAKVCVSVGVDRFCSEQLRGQLWFNPFSRGLYLCDGSVWVTVLQEHKRLDYVMEHQVLTTSSETYDVEVFRVPGLGLMAAMAHRFPSSGSAVYLWSQKGFQLYQNISSHEALAWRHFRVGKKLFLVVSNSGRGMEGEKEGEAKRSMIYKWSKKRKMFEWFQTLQTHCARDWEAFHIDGQAYLVVANHRQGDNNHTIDSVVYRWSPGTRSFEMHQALRTSGAYDWEYFTVGPYHFLAVANAFDGVTTYVDSVIYVWVNGRFQVFQTIKTFCATDWEMFKIGSRVFLVVANGHRLHDNGHSRYAINSTIYELDINEQLFIRFQDILTYSAVDWEFFALGEENFLVVANSFDGESYSLNSVVYRWQGYEGFVPVHWLPTIGCSDWEFFTSKGESYLIYSSAKASLAKVFKLKTL